ncbi:hypothetical protein BIY23_00855 [Wolbachia pipientis]|uniref:Uncharacterized protein n=1 Tax=Wolbachia pipientis TaxID=955 RepID=A0A1E7QKQ1_WOLPI|nr:hypothetical protein [Wolbachia pipientis]OEY87023.1 hypothetical protein BIY23_00855 [Wolbachia pipientis]
MVNIGKNKDNAVFTLQSYARDFNYQYLRQNTSNANSGRQAYLDIPRMNFVINGKNINNNLINKLYIENENLIKPSPPESDISTDYRPFAKAIFSEMFKSAHAPIPNKAILEEFVTNCNQSGYEFSYGLLLKELFQKHGLFTQLNDGQRTIYITIRSPDSIRVESKNPVISITDMENGKKICNMSYSLGFALESNMNKIEYKNGQISLTLPKNLKKYKVDDDTQQSRKNLFDIIVGFFREMVNKLFGSNNINITEKLNTTLQDVHSPVNDINNNLIR